MNAKMVQNPVLQENLQRLRERGMTVMEPGEGPLACRADGPGRLRDPEDIVEEASVLLSKQDLSGLRFLVTAGATEEPLDPVRYISNRSTGKMGYAVARAARRRGASVVLVSGPTALKAPLGVHLLRARTAEDMRRAVFEHRKGCDVIVKAAAVSDYRPRRTASEKIKKGQENLTLELIRNPDILAELGQTKADSPCILVGFAAETEGLLTHAKEKLEAKHLDMIVANDVSRDDAGFGTDTNVVKMIFRDGRIEDSSLMSKDAVADLVLDRVRELVEATHGGQGRT
jgi:phosphopantothenoylcysteine decarboxylase/phosphopantothenate--cysteine ligase